MPSNFAKTLKTTRTRKNLSQHKLSRMTSLSPSAICNFESGRRMPCMDSLISLADALGVTADYLIGRSTESNGSGPIAHKILRNLGKMSPENQEIVARLTTIMVSKDKTKPNTPAK